MVRFKELVHRRNKVLGAVKTSPFMCQGELIGELRDYAGFIRASPASCAKEVVSNDSLHTIVGYLKCSFYFWVSGHRSQSGVSTGTGLVPLGMMYLRESRSTFLSSSTAGMICILAYLPKLDNGYPAVS